MRDDKTEPRVAVNLKRLVVQTPSLLFLAGLDLLVRPRAMRDRTLKPRALAERVAEHRFERGEIGKGVVQIRDAGAGFFHCARDCNRGRRRHEKSFAARVKAW